MVQPGDDKKQKPWVRSWPHALCIVDFVVVMKLTVAPMGCLKPSVICGSWARMTMTPSRPAESFTPCGWTVLFANNFVSDPAWPKPTEHAGAPVLGVLGRAGALHLLSKNWHERDVSLFDRRRAREKTSSC